MGLFLKVSGLLNALAISDRNLIIANSFPKNNPSPLTFQFCEVLAAADRFKAISRWLSTDFGSGLNGLEGK
jgi:hypothetical protein